MDILFFKAAVAAYLASAVAYGFSLTTRQVSAARAGTWFLFAAFLCHSASFLAHFAASAGRTPLASIYETLSLFVWAMTGAYLVLQFKTKTRVLGAFISPVAVVVMIFASVRLGGEVNLPDPLRSSLVPVHVFLSVIGEALFVIAAAAAGMYLIQNRLIKNRGKRSLSHYLPSLQDLDRIHHVCLMAGFPVLTLGIFIGSIWARTAWGSAWQWDPKQVWTLAFWLSYAFLLHQRLAIGWKGHRAALFSVVALAVVIALFIAGAAFFPTVHRFA